MRGSSILHVNTFCQMHHLAPPEDAILLGCCSLHVGFEWKNMELSCSSKNACQITFVYALFQKIVFFQNSRCFLVLCVYRHNYIENCVRISEFLNKRWTDRKQSLSFLKILKRVLSKIANIAENRPKRTFFEKIKQRLATLKKCKQTLSLATSKKIKTNPRNREKWRLKP